VDAIHAEVNETSIMMLRHPALVAADRLEPGAVGRIDREDLFRRGLRAITPNGILGDARGATSQIGEAVLERTAEHIAGIVRSQIGR
jgi:creatinine amidohydrolase